MRKVKELLQELIRVRSVTGTAQERDVAQKILELIREDPYFKDHPDLCGAWDGGDLLGRPVVWALKKGSGRQTVVFSGHYDTVDTACYGIFEPYALNPDALKTAMLEAPPADGELQRDLNDENWLFGRGCADMKAGLALNLNALCEYDPGVVNVLFTAVSDEENLSAGARQAVGLYSLLQERFDLNYAIAVISESRERDTAAFEPHPFVNGCAGKILPFVVAKGIPAHGASMLRGLNPAHLIANVIRETEYDTALLSQGGSLFTEPPTVQLVRDLKAGYDVSMPEYTAAAFNMTFFSGPDSVKQMDKLLNNCKTAADELLIRYNDCVNEMERTGKIAPGRRKNFAVRVLTLEQLVAEISTQNGFDAYRQEAVKRSVRLIASGETLLIASILYIRDLMAFAGGGPMLVVGIAPPYYPAISNDNLSKDITPIVQDAIQSLEMQGIHTALEEYSKDMMDLSYMSCADPESVRRMMGNMPLPASVYDMDIDQMAKLEIPTLVIGPASKEIHMPGERVYLPDVEHDMPAVFRQIIKSTGNFLDKGM
jgi:arginine utilization protein RocB